MILYHYTSGRHLRAIAKYGLTVGDVPTDIKKERGRIGIWLTNSLKEHGHGLEGSGVNKQQYRLAVSINDGAPALHKWSDWASKHVTANTISWLHTAAGRRANPDSWFIYFDVIVPERIIECVEVATGAVVADYENVSPPALDIKAVPSWRREAWQKRMLKDVRRALAALRPK
jgi:hypothetical protein